MVERQPRSTILSSGVITLGGIIAWNIGNFVFFVLAARLIGAADFGLVAALVAVGVAALVPCGAVQASVGRLVAGRADPVTITPRTLVAAARWSAIGGVVGLVAIVALRLGNSRVPAVELAITLVGLLPLVPLHVTLGVLQGRHRFWAVAACFSVLGLSRPLLLLALAPAFSDSIAALLANAGSVIAAASLGVLLSRAEWAELSAPREGGRGLLRSIVAPFAALTGVALLANTDVVASKLSFADVDAGHFGAIAPLGKTAAMIVPMAIAFVLLPRVAERRSAGLDTGRLLSFGVAIVCIVDGVILAVAVPAAVIIPHVFGSDYAGASDLLVPVLAAAIPLGVLVVLVNHHIALNHRPFLWVVLLIGLMTLPALGVWHASPGQLLTVDAVLACMGVLAHEVLYGRTADGITRGLRRSIVARLSS